MKKILQLTALLALTSISAAYADTQTWDFDKTKVSTTTVINAGNAADYLPEGWQYKGGSWKIMKQQVGDLSQVLKTTASTNKDWTLVLPVHAGSLTFDVKSAGMFNEDNPEEIILYSVTESGEVGDEITRFTATDGALDMMQYIPVTLDVPADGYVAFSAGGNGGFFISTVTNTWEPAAASTTDTWTFEKTPVTFAMAINSMNAANIFPDGWQYKGTGWKIMPNQGGGVSQSIKSPMTAPESTNIIVFPAHAGTLSFYAKASTVFNEDNPETLVLYSSTEAGEAGDEIARFTAKDGDLNMNDYTPITLDVPADGYVAFSAGGNGGFFISKVTNTYTPSIATPKFTLSGTVKDEENNPLSDVKVTLGKASTLTDSEGAWTLSDVENGDYQLTFSKLGYAELSKEVTVADADQANVDVVMQLATTVLQGRATYDDDTNQTINVAGATVKLLNEEGDTIDTTTTDENGQYKFELKGDLSDLRYKLSATAKYFRDYNSLADFKLTTGDIITQNVYFFDKTLTLTVTVTAGPGTSVTNAVVTLTKENEEAQTLTGENGVYTLENINAYKAADANYTLQIKASGYASSDRTFTFDGESKEFEIELVSTGVTGPNADNAGFKTAYTLDGRMVSVRPLPAGLYVIDGEKTLVK